MSLRVFLFALIAFVVLFGSGYGAVAVSWLMPGPSVATYVDANGPGTITIGTNLPRPDWVVLPRDAMVVSGGLVVSGQHPQGAGSADVITHASLAEVRTFFLRELKRQGFEVHDLGLGPLNPASAALLGVADTLVGERKATKDCIAVQIRTEDGWLMQSRMLQLNWYKSDAKFAGVTEGCAGSTRVTAAP
jgi:hypothetical protein